MKKIFVLISILVFAFVLASCNKDDASEYDELFLEYQTLLEDNGYRVTLIDATNNVSGWLEITDEDVESIYRTVVEDVSDFVYIYRFPSVKQANKWHKKIEKHVLATNYRSLKDGPFVFVIFGSDIYEIIQGLNN